VPPHYTNKLDKKIPQSKIEQKKIYIYTVGRSKNGTMEVDYRLGRTKNYHSGGVLILLVIIFLLS